MEVLKVDLSNFYNENLLAYFSNLKDHPINMFTFILDCLIVGYLIARVLISIRHTRVSQLAKGILILVIITLFSDIE